MPELINKDAVLEAIDEVTRKHAVTARYAAREIRDRIKPMPAVFPTETQAAVLGMPEPAPAVEVEETHQARAVMAGFFEGSRLAFSRFCRVGTPWKEYDDFRDEAWRKSDSRRRIIDPLETVGKEIARSMGAHWADAAEHAAQQPAVDVAELVAEAKMVAEFEDAQIKDRGFRILPCRADSDGEYNPVSDFPSTPETVRKLATALTTLAAQLQRERERSERGRHVTCVYCGYQYEDGTPESQDARLTAHIKECEKHPMRELEAEVVLLKACCDSKCVDALGVLMTALNTWNAENPWLGVCASVALLQGKLTTMTSERDTLAARLAEHEPERLRKAVEGVNHAK